MDSNVKLVCTNPDDINLQVTVTLPIGQWSEIIRRNAEMSYYAPQDRLITAIREAVYEFKKQVNILIKED